MKARTDHNRPLNPVSRKNVGLAIVKTEHVENLDIEAAQCSCGWVAYHRRHKVLEDKIDRHLDKEHNRRGIRL